MDRMALNRTTDAAPSTGSDPVLPKAKRVILVGGAGDVGSLIAPELRKDHDVVIADRRVPPTMTSPNQVPFDVLEPAPDASIFRAGDVLVYLAMGPKSGWGTMPWARGQFDINVTGLYLTIQAAATRGVQKVVIASSMSVFADYLNPSGQPHEPDANDAYGLSKRLGEHIGRAAATASKLDVIALRLVAPVSDEEWLRGDPPYADIMTASSDVAAAVRAAVVAALPGFHAFTISGDHRNRNLDMSSARDLLNWEPKARRPTAD